MRECDTGLAANALGFERLFGTVGCGVRKHRGGRVVSAEDLDVAARGVREQVAFVVGTAVGDRPSHRTNRGGVYGSAFAADDACDPAHFLDTLTAARPAHPDRHLP